jgi:hypothetical protein
MNVHFLLICVAAFSYHITFDFLLCCQKPTKTIAIGKHNNNNITLAAALTLIIIFLKKIVKL